MVAKQWLKKHLPTSIVSILIGGITSIIVAYTELESSKHRALVDTNQILIECQRNVMNMNVLVEQANKEGFSEKQLKEEYKKLIDNIPFIVWIKEYDEKKDEFRMWLLSTSYSRILGISAKKYEGRTDEEIWGKDIATEYADTDRAVIDHRGCITRFEYASNPYNSKIPVTKCLVTIGDKDMVVGFAEPPKYNQ